MPDEFKPHTYYLTRSSNSNGELSAMIDVWYRRPVGPRRLAFNRGRTWLPSDPPDGIDWKDDIGYYGAYSVQYCLAAFKTVPETDGECIVCETMQKVEN